MSLFILKINITQEENQYFVNNKRFYNLLMGTISKITGQIPFTIKREFVKLNRGDISIKLELEEAKSKITLEQLKEHDNPTE